jgi:L,D-transpeptidase ErfK/SrfK
MGLSVRGYGIHGTNAPKSIGKAASHGCVRMSKRDLEELFERDENRG